MGLTDNVTASWENSAVEGTLAGCLTDACGLACLSLSLDNLDAS